MKKAELQKALHIAEVDEAYTINYPHIEAYVSLYAGTKNDEDADEPEGEKIPAAKLALSAERPEMWHTIEKAMLGGKEALRQIREKRRENDVPENRSAPHPSRAALISNPHQDWKASGRAKEGEQPELNRRERRKRMREAIAAGAKVPDDDDNNGAGFFEV